MSLSGMQEILMVPVWILISYNEKLQQPDIGRHAPGTELLGMKFLVTNQEGNHSQPMCLLKVKGIWNINAFFPLFSSLQLFIV